MALSGSQSTVWVEDTQDILDTTKTRLEATGEITGATSWNVEIFPGSNYEDLFRFVPELGLPCAAVIYGGSDWQNKPLRELRVSVLVACESFAQAADTTLTTLVDQAMTLCDGQTLNQAEWMVESDQYVDIRPGIAASLVTFKVEDH